MLVIFFDTSNGSGWQTPAQELTSYWKASVYNWLALALRALGRLEEALEVTSLGLEMRVQQKNWVEAAQDSNNLSELQLILGNTSNNILSAIGAAKQSVLFAERSGNIYQRIVNRTT